jgi:tetratricopeptide (TPR) repeat protein
LQIAEADLRTRPQDPNAHFRLGSVVGVQASYGATVEGRVLASFRAARRAYDAHERVLELDPSRKDAGLIVGTYRYVVSLMSLPLRMMAYVAGFGGGKDRGIRMVEESASAASEDQTDALFALVLLYNREKRYADALKVLGTLRHRYPRNRLVVLEAGATAIRANRPAEAEEFLSEGLRMFTRDARRKMAGEAALWHYKRGAARVLLKRREDALADLSIAVEPDAAGWVRGRAHLELARLAMQENRRHDARREAALAVDECTKDRDPLCVGAAKSIVK